MVSKYSLLTAIVFLASSSYAHVYDDLAPPTPAAPHPTVPRGYSCVCPTAPVSTSAVVTKKKQRTTVPTVIQPFTYTSGALERAIGMGTAVTTAPDPTRTQYPHIFHNYGGRITYASGCPTSATVVEFPMWSNPAQPGADTNRVLYGYNNFEFCGCITHLGAANPGGFIQCRYPVPAAAQADEENDDLVESGGYVDEHQVPLIV